MPRTCAPGRCPHVILLKGTLRLAGTRRSMFSKGPVLVEDGGEEPHFRSRQDAHYCIKRTQQIHRRLRAALLETSFWPAGLPEFQIMSTQKWTRLCKRAAEIQISSK